MNLGQLRSLLRTSRLDDTAQPPLWSDETLNAHIADAVRQACMRARLLIDAQTASVTKINVTAGTATYALHPSILSIRNARLPDGRALDIVPLKWMDRELPGWQSDGSTQTPWYLIPDENPGMVRLYPIPAEAVQLSLSVWRMPLEAEAVEGDSDDPPIPEHMHIDLLDWAEHLAYSLADAETRDPARSDAAAARFTAKFGPLPSWASMVLWGRAPRRGSRPEFV